MKQHHRHKLSDGSDSQVLDALRQMHESIELPDGEQAWLQMKNKLELQQRKSSRIRRWGAVCAAACFLLVVGLSFSAINEGYAVNRLFIIMKKSQDGASHVFFGTRDPNDTTGAKTAPPPPDGGPEYSGPGPELGGGPPGPVGPGMVPEGTLLVPEVTTLDAARKKLSFQIRLPKELPSGFTLMEVKILEHPKGIFNSVDLEYRNDDGKTFRISEDKVQSSGTSTAMSVGGDSVKVEEIEIGGERAVLVASTYFVRLQWIARQVNHVIDGQLTEEEALQVARSIR